MPYADLRSTGSKISFFLSLSIFLIFRFQFIFWSFNKIKK